MSLYYRSCGNAGSGFQFLLIHGWGMNSGIWSDIAPQLARHLPDYEITLVDLPGYGQSDMPAGEYNSAILAEALMPLLEHKQTIIAGWSMGALVALELTKKCYLHVSHLLLLSATPCFVQKENWPHAVTAELFESFSRSLDQDHQATLKRFLAIQAMGSPTAKKDIKAMQQQLLQQGEADEQALKQGLAMLLSEDKRDLLYAIDNLPVALIAGKRDTLVKVEALEQLTRQENIALYTLSAAGHAPFISHPQEFVSLLLKAIK